MATYEIIIETDAPEEQVLNLDRARQWVPCVWLDRDDRGEWKKWPVTVTSVSEVVD